MNNVLELTASLFSQNNVRLLSIGKSHPSHYQVFYVKNGVTRVMLVPKSSSDLMKIQEEILILLSRSSEEQQRIGYLDLQIS